MIRKEILSLALPLAMVACSSSGAAAPRPAAAAPPNDQPLRDAVTRLAAAWNAGDGDAWGVEYWPDGSLTNILGDVFPTAQAVAAVTNTILAGPFKGSTFTPVIRRVRFIGTDAAIVETDVSVTNFRALPPGAVATQPGLLLTRLTHVFKKNGVWKIEASQNTAVAPGVALS
jgi:uncharacterized protein (TIGR02246 family)